MGARVARGVGRPGLETLRGRMWRSRNGDLGLWVAGRRRRPNEKPRVTSAQRVPRHGRPPPTSPHPDPTLQKPHVTPPTPPHLFFLGTQS